ncbi:MAG: carboxymuconolactone decarboxylase family protein [Corynebacterium sp.]|uniref:carboxymuconolactone decarboxylase family protein n=1 Tax=unclassified Corynebacterium TaxID=2624378 RepID=UPI00095CE1F7|nr:carboxymuconolactone decarboxylase family protein [Corynebacterium sp. CNJ-954]OLT53705.1 carboxymuconolactone decarboxylase [Corynebacterium sp. CNJ-954]
MSNVRVTPWSSEDQDGDEPDIVKEIRQRRPGGELIGIDRVLLRSTPLATGWNGLLGRVRAEFALKLEYREMIMLRVAHLNGADFEWNVHHPAYLDAGGSEAKALKLRETTVADIFSEEERALLELTDQSTLNVSVDGGVINDVKELFGEEQTVEATATVAAYNMVSRFLVALAI